MNEFKNKLYFGDCLDILKDLYEKYPQGFIDLIYIDPPFNSKRNYNVLFEDVTFDDTQAQKQAFADTWSNVSYKDTLQQLKDINLDLSSYLDTLDKLNLSKGAVSYLTTIAIRIWYMHKILNSTGTFYLHCDPTMSHYLKIICDLIFNVKNFQNEIVWCYTSPAKVSVHFPRKHDIILFYSKSIPRKLNINDIRVPYSEESLSRANRNVIKKGGTIFNSVKLHKSGKIPEDWWADIVPASRKPGERLGYPTQKPIELMERIIKASSEKGNIVADFFCGCGTTISAAEKVKRKWIGVDISHLAIGLIEKRLIHSYGKQIKDTYEIHGFPKDIASAKKLSLVKGGRLEFQDWIIESKLGGIHNPKKTADGGWDGHVTFDLHGKKEIVLIEVKSGNVNVKNMREFIHVINKQSASIGVFVCFADQVTKPMLLEAKNQGYYNKNIFGNRYDKIQILTVEDILNDKEIQKPTSTKETFKTASIVKEQSNQEKLF